MSYKIIPAFIVFFILSFTAFAETAAVKSYDDFPQTGVLAAYGNLPAESIALPQLPMGIFGQAVPVLASLSLSKTNQWFFSIKNNTDAILKIQIEVIQYDIDRNRLAGNAFQYKIRSGSNADGSIPAASKTIGSIIFLKSWSLDK